MSFETALLIEVTRLRKLFADRDAPYLYFGIDVSGPVDRDEIEILFSISTDRYGDEVKGDKIDAVVTEMFRRKGWKAQHNALKLSYMTDHSENE